MMKYLFPIGIAGMLAMLLTPHALNAGRFALAALRKFHTERQSRRRLMQLLSLDREIEPRVYRDCLQKVSTSLAVEAALAKDGIKVTCSWCNAHLRGDPSAQRISHGICPSCCEFVSKTCPPFTSKS